ncbi:hypothetical protein SEEE2558_05109, partial [Salmonella enterica subsp. enterica serovar Enteritidis str. 22558]
GTFMAHTIPAGLNLVLRSLFIGAIVVALVKGCGENSRCFALIFYNELCKIAHPRLR